MASKTDRSHFLSFFSVGVLWILRWKQWSLRFSELFSTTCHWGETRSLDLISGVNDEIYSWFLQRPSLEICTRGENITWLVQIKGENPDFLLLCITSLSPGSRRGTSGSFCMVVWCFSSCCCPSRACVLFQFHNPLSIPLSLCLSTAGWASVLL